MTKNAKKLLDFINSYIKKNSIAPSFDEMKNYMNLKSKSSIFQYLQSLEEEGFIKKNKLKSRSIEILNTIPYFQTISAGKSYDINNELNESINISDLIKNDKKNTFACKVNGNSMESHGIYNGDIIILEKETSVKKNNIYAVQIDNNEITLKKIRILGNTIELIGDEENFTPISYSKNRINILGKIVNLIRNY